VSPPAARRTAADLERLWPRLGRDLALVWAGPAGGFDGGDLLTASRPGPGLPLADVAVTERVDSAVQFLVNRLMTRQGELAPLGHPLYGSRHHELIGEPNTERTRNLVKLYVLACLRREARVQRVEKCVVTSPDRRTGIVRIELTVRLVDDDRALDVVLPFDLAGPTGGTG
jgi:phage baseplate assembly protein W